jgi:molybdenum cofactor cytidylyltransferase
MDEIWAIILAAGESKRMGSPKMLLPFKGRSMIENVISNVFKSKADEIIVVLGAYFDELSLLMKRLDVSYCFNDNYMKGMLSSVQYGFKNLPQDYKAALVFQGDQPLIPPAVVDRVIDEYIHSCKGIIVPVFNSRRGHPLLVDKKYRGEIEKLLPDEGLHSLLDKFGEDLLEVETGEPGILRDFDTYDEYRKGINQIQ